MCKAPSTPPPIRWEADKAPAYRDANTMQQTGRRSTILTGGGGVMPSSMGGKKTLLGQ